jgi:hypothetical protein
MDQNQETAKDKPKFQSDAIGRTDLENGKPLPPEELKQVPDEARLIALIMLIKLIEELIHGLNRIERRTWWLIFVEGKSIHQVALSEGVSRQAIYSRLERMIAHHEYTEIACRHGSRRPRINQHEYRSGHFCRPRTSSAPAQSADIDCWESEGGGLADGPQFR